MKIKLIYRTVLSLILLVMLTGCTDKKAEEEIAGQWRAIELEEDGTGTIHSLPEGIIMEFEYPVYRFEGDVSEEGKFCINNYYLYLLTEHGGAHRKVSIAILTPDSLSIIVEYVTGLCVFR